MIHLLIVAFWTLFFYLVISILTKDEIVKTYKYRLLNEYTKFNLKRANKAQRVFHLIFDACFAILVTSNLVMILPIKSLRWLSNIIGEQYVITLLLLVCITFYYIVFELIFKSTPAKFLTQTKVVSLTDQPITSGQIIAKSFSRRLPFNPLSFLTEQLGWHDSLSKTTVVQLTRKGKHGSWYWLIIPFFIGLFAIFFYATLYLRKYENFKIGENNYNNQKYDIQRKLNTISEFDFITLSETNNRFSSNHYLKVGFIGKDSIDCYKINDSYLANSLQKADQYYGGYYNGLEVVTLSKQDLNNAICESYDFDGEFSDCGLKLLEHQRAVRIKKIESLNEPTIDLDNVSFEQKRNGDYGFIIRLSNTDKRIIIENIKTDNKDILFTTTFPYFGSDSYNKEKYSIEGSGLEPKQSTIFKLQIKDTLTEQRFIYSLELEGRYTKILKLVKSL
ncbi:RDD family protein [Olleya sp. HaHaR_3_96]|uniref:RDD family protein n=1 Tax=Olleya sp. HaHaR_3_96 TaxID=2745560 RepID=UPI001C4FF836|nr:RDD family protein [Olleya sp. HaHaR_3_96]QXP58647.1 RDD family protein [Olleya sp. HaHaR_3_96]